MTGSARLIVKNGTVVTATDIFKADVLVVGGKIAAIGKDIEETNHAASDKTIEATGMLVVPGGVDPHVHLQYPQGPNRVVSSDTWATGTTAAAFGGTTTVVDFVEAAPGETWMEAFEKRLALADPQATIDFGFHMSFNRADEASLAEVPSVMGAGMPTFKIYMAYDGIRLHDDEFLRALYTLKEQGGLAIVHAENHDVIMTVTKRLVSAGRTAPRYHPFSRPVGGEAEATERALYLADIVGVPMHIVHVSSELGLEAINRARGRGRQVHAEVCIQHMLLTDDLYNRDDFEPAKYSMAPPLRKASDNEAMWAGLIDGSLDFVVTDHCPFFFKGQKDGASRLPPRVWDKPQQTERWYEGEGLPPFNRIPGGAPGIEARFPLVYTFGVRTGRISPNRWVEICSTAAAKIFGMYPRKGTIAPGSDADIVIFDPRKKITLGAQKTLHENCDYTPYEGYELEGYPVTVISRGEVIVQDGEFAGREGRGEFVKRGL